MQPAAFIVVASWNTEAPQLMPASLAPRGSAARAYTRLIS